MRVVHVIKAKGIAGAERHLLDLMEGLRVREVDAQLLLLAEEGHSADGMQKAVEARQIPVQRVTMRRHIAPGLYSNLNQFFNYLKPDIVHTHLQHADFYGIPAAKLARVPKIVSSQHNDDSRRRNPALKIVNSNLWRLADAVITISDAVRRFTLEVEGLTPEKVHTIHYGLPLPVPEIDKPEARRVLRNELQCDPETPLVGMACRLIDAKGIEYALVAFEQIAAEFPTARFAILGDGPLRRSLEAQARALKIQQRVHFLGWRDEALPFIAGLDVLLSPSVREGFGMTILEAMGQQIPVIGSTASAIPEIIVHGETGLLVPPRDVPALAEAIRCLLADKPLRMYYGLVGCSRLEERFSASRMVVETLNLYQNLLDKKTY